MVEQNTMRVWECRGYGGPEVLQMARRSRPQAGADEVVMAVRASTVDSADVRIRTQNLPRGFGLLGRLAFGWRRPRQPVLGTAAAGVIVGKGAKVTAFDVGDAVLAVAGARMGCHAEYCILSVSRPVLRLPPKLNFEQAASLPFGGLTALHFLEKAGLRAGQSVLVIGASGAVGSAFVQIARILGAEVSAVTSTRNVALVRGLGAGAVIDYTQDDFLARPERYDLIVDAVNASSFGACQERLTDAGCYVSVAGDLAATLVRGRGRKRSLAGPAGERREHLQQLLDWAQQGRYKPLIDRGYAFEDLPAAHAYAESGRKRGSVILRVSA